MIQFDEHIFQKGWNQQLDKNVQMWNFQWWNCYTLDVAPSQDSSDHQDYIFSRESRTKPSFTTVTGRRPHPN